MATRLDTLELMVSRSPNDPFPYYCLAQEYRSASRPEEALTAFANLRDRFPEYVPQYLMAAQVCESLKRIADARDWLTRGVAAARAKRDSHALGELESSLAALPPDAP